MELKAEDVDAIEDLTLNQVRALEKLMAMVEERLAEDVLKCSLGRADIDSERSLVACKHRHEGSMKAGSLFKKEILRLRKAADERRPA